MKNLTILLILSVCLFSCTVSEHLTTPDYDDRKIIGISKNGKKYLSVDGYGKKSGKIKPVYGLPDSTMIGMMLICEDEFDR